MILATPEPIEIDDRFRQRFLSKTKLAASARTGMDSPCLEWTASKNNKGYGQFGINNKNYLAHRVAWLIEHREFPPLNVLHRCDNPLCVRCDHLFSGTQADNMSDMARKGRHVSVTHPERLARGDRNGKRTHPEMIARGEHHWTRFHHGRLPCGDAHWSRLHPEKVRRGEKSHMSKLTEAAVRSIFSMRSQGLSMRRIAEEFNVTRTLIGYVCNRTIWKHVDLSTEGTETK